MQIHSLDFDDFYDISYYLIGIHTTVEDYKLAYLLNKTLQIKLYKTNDLDFKNKNNNAKFSLFEYHNKKLDQKWFLIHNVNNQTIVTNQSELFAEQNIKSYLIPENKKVDDLLK